MLNRRKFSGLALALASGAASAAFEDPLDKAAAKVRSPSRSSLLGVAAGGTKLVAVGLRGLVVTSGDGGVSWQQVATPLSSDLVSVAFFSDSLGWATGHDGVLLSTQDSGASWQLRMDGRRMAEILIHHFEQAASAGRPLADKYLESVRMNFATGPEHPILGVWFQDAARGWAISTFGMILGTIDGGRTWTSWMEQVDNPDLLHFYAITGVGSDVYITAERGQVFKLDPTQQRFRALPTGYEGGLFGLVGSGSALLTFGLQGNALRSQDGGHTWERVATGVHAGLNAGIRLHDGRIALVTQDGRLLWTSDLGSSFKVLPAPRQGLLTGIAQQGKQLVVSGFNGVQQIPL